MKTNSGLLIQFYAVVPDFLENHVDEIGKRYEEIGESGLHILFTDIIDFLLKNNNNLKEARFNVSEPVDFLNLERLFIHVIETEKKELISDEEINDNFFSLSVIVATTDIEKGELLRQLSKGSFKQAFSVAKTIKRDTIFGVEIIINPLEMDYDKNSPDNPPTQRRFPDRPDT